MCKELIFFYILSLSPITFLKNSNIFIVLDYIYLSSYPNYTYYVFLHFAFFFAGHTRTTCPENAGD